MEATDPNELSCHGIDGVGPGSVLVFDVTQDPRPSSIDENDCYAFRTTDVHGLSDADLESPGQGTPAVTSASVLTGAAGAFVSPSNNTCHGDWSVTLAPPVTVMLGETASPLDGGANTWVVGRGISLINSEGCWDLSTTGGIVYSGAESCADLFAVASITEVSKP
jgi:hypothetical protein